MFCPTKPVPRSSGHVVIVNAPHGVDTSSIYAALGNHIPLKVLKRNTGFLPGVTSVSEQWDVHSIDNTNELAQSATYLAKQGMVPVVEMRDASHAHVAAMQRALPKTEPIPVTNIMLYAPLERLAADSKGNVTDILKALQDYGHLFRGAFEPTLASIDHITREQFDGFFARLKKGMNDDDRKSANILQQFLTSLLGLDVRPEVHIEPRFDVYDAILRLTGEAKRIAKDVATHVKAGDETRRLSALYRLQGSGMAHVPTCTHCSAEMRRSEPALAAAPNGRLHSALPACGQCLDLARVGLIGTSLAERPSSANVEELLVLLQNGGDIAAVAQSGDSEQATRAIATLLQQLGHKVNTNVSGQDDPMAGVSEADKGKPWHDLIRYNEVFQKSSKNSNARSESLMDQLLYHHVRSLELDISVSKGMLLWGQSAPLRDWFMAHDTTRGWYESHQHDTLSAVLTRLKAFHATMPQHEAVTLFINVNDNFGGKIPQKGHTPEDLDALLAKHLGRANLFGPQHLKGTAASIQAGAKRGWPTLTELQGKFIPVIVEGADAYADAQDIAEGRLCFVAQKDVAHKDMIHRHNWNVFFDQSTSFDLVSKDIKNAGFVSRQWVESQWAMQQAIRKRAHHIATKSLNYHHNGWSKTHTPKGFPFLPFTNGFRGFNSANAAEPQRLISVQCTTGDLWGTADNALFASHEDHTAPGEWTEYEWYLSNANSHMHKWARAGIAFRASKNDEGAAYFALVRPSQYNYPAQVQLRSQPDAHTVAAPGRNAAATHFRMRCRYMNGSTECEAHYSEDGSNWRLIRSTSIPGRLSYHGLIASSKSNSKNTDSTQYQFLFGNVSKNGKALHKADFPLVNDIGMVFSVPRIADGLGGEAVDFDDY